MIGYFIVGITSVFIGAALQCWMSCRSDEETDRQIAIRDEKIAMLQSTIEEYRIELGL